ncbi:MAG TPA: hypothetical protein VHZ04_02535 [Candidatus Paceibacterota bacterium]|jgi:hypothetical protein|nr:hypothetical protein [Candidatus Paceibacterota bacterium]
MVQDSLVEYISSQLKLGVSRETVKAALMGAGWQAADVEDTLKKVEGDMKAAAPAGTTAGKPASLGMSGGMAAGAGMGGVAKPSDSQSIRVSDLISSSGPGSSGSSADSFFTKSAPASAPMGKSTAPSTGPVAMGGAASMSGGTALKSLTKSSDGAKTKPIDLSGMKKMGGTEFPPKGKKPIGLIVTVVLAVVFAGLAGYLYFENMGLGSQVAALGGQSASVTSQVASLNSQVQALNASNTALAAEDSSLSATDADLLANISFVAVPLDASGSATTSVSVSGSVAYIKPLYVLTTSYGVTVYVKNSTDAQVIAALKPFLASAASSSTPGTVTLTGDHAAGSSYLTVTAVNGSPVQ